MISSIQRLLDGVNTFSIWARTWLRTVFLKLSSVISSCEIEFGPAKYGPYKANT